MKKEQAFGYGKAKYQREEDFPYELVRESRYPRFLP